MKGVYTALVTPFDSHGALDLKAFRKILDDQIDAKGRRSNPLRDNRRNTHPEC
jgi:hypothetical protein